MSRSGIYFNIQNYGNSYTALSSFSILCLMKMNLTAKTELVTQMAEHCSVSNKNSIYQQQVLSDRVLFLFSKPFKTSTFLGQVLGPILASLACVGDPHPSLVPSKTEKPSATASHLQKEVRVSRQIIGRPKKLPQALLCVHPGQKAL